MNGFVRLFVVSALSLSLFANKPSPVTRSFAIAVVPSSESMPFYARMTNGQQRVLIVPSEQSSGIVKRFNVGVTQKIYMVELKNENVAVAHELFGFGRIKVFAAANSSAAHAALDSIGEFSVPVEVSDELIYPVSPKSEFVDLTNNPVGQLPEISAEDLRKKLEEFTGARETTIAGTTVTLGERSSASGREKARAWLGERYKALGYSVSTQKYATGINFVAEKIGKDPSHILIVSSHYDTVRTAGADDDGAGTISALLTAEAMATEEHIPTLRFVAFDQEELGLLGSKAYAKFMKTQGEIEKLDGVINLEMTGYDKDNDGAFHSIDCNENDSANLTRLLNQLILSAGLAIHRVEACTNRSDHASFWNYDRPAIVISQNFFGGDSNPCYHKACDTTQNLNWEYFYKVTRASAGLVKQVSQTGLR